MPACVLSPSPRLHDCPPSFPFHPHVTGILGMGFDTLAKSREPTLLENLYVQVRCHYHVRTATSALSPLVYRFLTPYHPLRIPCLSLPPSTAV